MLYRSIEGDMVDLICHRHYGDTSMVEAVYDANPGLAQLGPVLPRGTVVDLPEKPITKPKPMIRLWGAP